MPFSSHHLLSLFGLLSAVSHAAADNVVNNTQFVSREGHISAANNSIYSVSPAVWKDALTEFNATNTTPMSGFNISDSSLNGSVSSEEWTLSIGVRVDVPLASSPLSDITLPSGVKKEEAGFALTVLEFDTAKRVPLGPQSSTWSMCAWVFLQNSDEDAATGGPGGKTSCETLEGTDCMKDLLKLTTATNFGACGGFNPPPSCNNFVNLPLYTNTFSVNTGLLNAPIFAMSTPPVRLGDPSSLAKASNSSWLVGVSFQNQLSPNSTEVTKSGQVLCLRAGNDSNPSQGHGGEPGNGDGGDGNAAPVVGASGFWTGAVALVSIVLAMVL